MHIGGDELSLHGRDVTMYKITVTNARGMGFPESAANKTVQRLLMRQTGLVAGLAWAESSAVTNQNAPVHWTHPPPCVVEIAPRLDIFQRCLIKIINIITLESDRSTLWLLSVLPCTCPPV